MGRLVNTRGNTAQCIAQAREVATPNASQLIRKFMAANIGYHFASLQQSCKSFVSIYVKCTFYARGAL